MSGLEKVCVRLEAAATILQGTVDKLQKENQELRKTAEASAKVIKAQQDLLNEAIINNTQLKLALQNSQPNADEHKTQVAFSALGISANTGSPLNRSVLQNDLDEMPE